ncbi:MAG: sulfatase [Armatimonadota bacterium]|nr:MAG: sulfatase [Armatimonadota bacterium]
MKRWYQACPIIGVTTLALAGVVAPPALIARGRGDWPPPRPVVTFTAADLSRPAREAKVRTRDGRVHPLSVILAVRREQLDRAAIAGVLENTVYAPTPAVLQRRATLPEGGTLTFDYGLLHEAWRKPGGAVRFAATVTTPAGRRLARWSDTVEVGSVRERRWRTARINLSAHAGERVVMRLMTRVAGGGLRRSAGSFAVWGNPALVGDDGAAEKPNVVLIVIDALRADHLGCYGYARPTSPNLDGLASRGLRFAAAYSQAPWTMPSVASILTSRYPGEIRDQQRLGLDPAVPTFAEALDEHGYTCAAITANPVATWNVGFARGFDSFDVYANRFFVWRSAEMVTERAQAWLRRPARRPFLLYLHYMDPHDPYAAPETFRRRFAHTNYTPQHRAIAAGHAKEIEEGVLGDAGCELSRDDVEYLRALYDAEIAYVDALVGRLLGELEQAELTDNTAIIVTADHGEEFCDHEWIRHGRSLYRELLHVPLIVVPPGALTHTTVVEEPVALTDIGGTVLDIAGVSPVFGRGRSLLRVGDRGGRTQPVFSQLGSWMIGPPKRGQRPGQSLITGNWHLIAWDGGAAELYDMARDPGERRNLAGVEPDRAAQLRGQLADVSQEMAPRGPLPQRAGRKVDEETMRRLKALGYVD